MSSTLRIDMSHLYGALRFYGDVIRSLTTSPDDLWSAPLPTIPQSVAREIESWTKTLLQNVPVPIPSGEAKPAAKVIAVDASGGMFAATCLDRESGRSRPLPWC